MSEIYLGTNNLNENKMAEQKEQKKLSYEELERVCAEMQRRLSEQNRVNEFRELAYLSLEMLKCGDVLPKSTKTKIINFLDRLIPVPTEQAEPDK